MKEYDEGDVERAFREGMIQGAKEAWREWQDRNNCPECGEPIPCSGFHPAAEKAGTMEPAADRLEDRTTAPTEVDRSEAVDAGSIPAPPAVHPNHQHACSSPDPEGGVIVGPHLWNRTRSAWSGFNLPPGCYDEDIDNAAPSRDMNSPDWTLDEEIEYAEWCRDKAQDELDALVKQRENQANPELPFVEDADVAF